MIIRFICPLMYSLVLGTVWGEIFKKKYSSSLAPAFMSHIIIVLLTGLIFNRLSIGIYGGICVSLVIGIVIIILKYRSITKNAIYEYLNRIWNEGVFVFLVLYVFCFLTNYGKRFLAWDEFSHWGMFLKESIRLDRLYCTSPLWFDHKDYVPAITLFEVIWCKLGGRFSEADAYRAIQIFMISMLMPMCETFDSHSYAMIKNNKGIISAFKARVFQLSAVVIILLIPLVFNTGNGFCFYHSIYCDIAVGIVFFWCLLESYRKYNSIAYQLIILTIGITVLVLSKMMAMALMPLVVGLLIINAYLIPKKRPRGLFFAWLIPVMLIPAGVWCWFNKFVDRFVENRGNGQSYDGMKLSSLREVFANPTNSNIPYLKELRDAYIDAIIHRDILIHGSYVVVLFFVIIAFFVLANLSREKTTREKVVAAGVWSLFSGVYYGLLMYFLYATAFVEFEAVNLASYERYMNSFIIAVVFFVIAVYYDSRIWKRYINCYYLLFVLLIVDLSFVHIKVFDQVLPGVITHDEEKVGYYTTYASSILSSTREDESIYVVKRGDTGDFLIHLILYCNPRIFKGGSVGPAVDEDDLWSRDISTEEFLNEISECDYIYFCGLDESFVEKYSEVFDNPEQLIDGIIYRINVVDSRVILSDTAL